MITIAKGSKYLHKEDNKVYTIQYVTGEGLGDCLVTFESPTYGSGWTVNLKTLLTDFTAIIVKGSYQVGDEVKVIANFEWKPVSGDQTLFYKMSSDHSDSHIVFYKEQGKVYSFMACRDTENEISLAERSRVGAKDLSLKSFSTRDYKAPVDNEVITADVSGGMLGTSFRIYNGEDVTYMHLSSEQTLAFAEELITLTLAKGK